MKLVKARGCIALLVLVSGMALARLGSLPPKDWKGSADHPLISRFTGAVIVGYETKDYDATVVPLALYRGFNKQIDKQYTKAKVVEGKTTRVAYAVPQGKTTLEIFRNYEQALAKAGFRTLFTCAGGSGCGYDFAYPMSQLLINRQLGDDNAMIDVLSPVGDDVRYLGAVLTRPAGDVHVAVTVAKNMNTPFPGVLLQIVESQVMQTGQVTVDASAIAAALESDGKIALYGIQFDTDSATLKPESQQTLAEMAKFLAASPQVKAHIVGHTDNTGSLQHNLDLSQRRADAVVKALVTEHGVAAQRLAAKGLASYAPVASNRAEAGRARNRRVELVEQ